jgi:hypothetical protein
MAKVCKPDGQGTFAGTQGDGEVAPMPDLPALAPERGSSTSKPPFAARDIGRILLKKSGGG